MKSLKLQEGDVVSPYYGALGFKLLDEPLVKVLQMDNCAHLQKHFKSDSGPEVAFYALSAFSALGCSGKLHNEEVVKVQSQYKIHENQKHFLFKYFNCFKLLQLAFIFYLYKVYSLLQTNYVCKKSKKEHVKSIETVTKKSDKFMLFYGNRRSSQFQEKVFLIPATIKKKL